MTPTPVNPTTPSVNQCGIKAPGHTRIVGGSNARPGDWPWQVKIPKIKLLKELKIISS